MKGISMDLKYYRLGMFFQSIFDVNLKLRSTKETGNIYLFKEMVTHVLGTKLWVGQVDAAF